jgi:hypothetical protein
MQNKINVRKGLGTEVIHSSIECQCQDRICCMPSLGALLDALWERRRVLMSVAEQHRDEPDPQQDREDLASSPGADGTTGDEE